MTMLAGLQKKHIGDRVQIMSISDESPEDINTFLDQPYPVKGDEETQPGLTYREAYEDYTVATNTNRKIFTDVFLELGGSDGFPFCVVIGRSGLVEWHGHTSELEKPLQQIVDGDWDREEQRIATREKFRQQRVGQLARLIDNRFDAIAFRDFLNLELKHVQDDEQRDEINLLRSRVSLSLGEIDDDCLRILTRHVDQLDSDEGDSELLGIVLNTNPFRANTSNRRQLLQRLTASLKSSSRRITDEDKPILLLALAKLHIQNGQIELAEKTYEKALALVPEENRASYEEFYSNLQTWYDSESDQ